MASYVNFNFIRTLKRSVLKNKLIIIVFSLSGGIKNCKKYNIYNYIYIILP